MLQKDLLILKIKEMEKEMEDCPAMQEMQSLMGDMMGGMGEH